MTDILSIWRIDADGYIVSPANTKVARLEGDALYLYDKKLRVGLPFRLVDWTHLLTLLSSPRTGQSSTSRAGSDRR